MSRPRSPSTSERRVSAAITPSRPLDTMVRPPSATHAVMGRIDQHGFDNQPDYLGSAEAAALLGVKRETLYAYVSRGLVRSVQVGGGHRYSREDLERLRARHDAR